MRKLGLAELNGVFGGNKYFLYADDAIGVSLPLKSGIQYLYFDTWDEAIETLKEYGYDISSFTPDTDVLTWRIVREAMYDEEENLSD